MFKNLRLLVVLGVLALAVLALALFLAPTRNDPNEYVLRLKWLHQAQFAGFYAAQDDELYKRAGLSIRIEQGGPDFPAVKMVAAGGEHFGVAGADQILLARSQGVDVVPLMVIYSESPFILFSRTSDNINRPADLIGHKVGVKRGGNEELIYRALLKRAGVNVPPSDEVPVQFDLSPFFAGSVDVWPGYAINEPLQAREKGLDIRLLVPSEYGVNLYADTLFTSGKMIREHPQAVRKFVQATREGWRAMVQNPDRAGSVSMNYATNSSLPHQVAMMKASLRFIDARKLGVMNEAGWQRTHQLLREGGFLSKDVDLGAMLTAAREAGGLVQ